MDSVLKLDISLQQGTLAGLVKSAHVETAQQHLYVSKSLLLFYDSGVQKSRYKGTLVSGTQRSGNELKL